MSVQVATMATKRWECTVGVQRQPDPEAGCKRQWTCERMYRWTFVWSNGRCHSFCSQQWYCHQWISVSTVWHLFQSVYCVVEWLNQERNLSKILLELWSVLLIDLWRAHKILLLISRIASASELLKFDTKKMHMDLKKNLTANGCTGSVAVTWLTSIFMKTGFVLFQCSVVQSEKLK